jgi:hypothetical protein
LREKNSPDGWAYTIRVTYGTQTAAAKRRVRQKECSVDAAEDTDGAVKPPVGVKANRDYAKEGRGYEAQYRVVVEKDRDLAEEDRVFAKEDRVFAKEDRVFAKEDPDSETGNREVIEKRCRQLRQEDWAKGLCQLPFALSFRHLPSERG